MRVRKGGSSYMYLPIKEFGIVIFSHIRSFTSRPDSLAAIALATRYIGDVNVNFTRSRSDSGIEEAKEGEEFDVIVLSVGLPVKGRPYSPAEGRQRERKRNTETDNDAIIYTCIYLDHCY